MVVLKSGVTDTGAIEYYLVGLEKYKDIEAVLDRLIHLKAKILDTLDGIYSRVATLEMEGIVFKVIYHEDVGVYSYIVDHSSAESNNRLKQILEQVVNDMGVRWYSSPE
jgi:hypothetical protein